MLGEFQDIESGKNDARPELAKARSRCRRTGARLLIAKLDRLSRDVAFISALMKDRVKFTSVDMPDVNDLTIHIMAAVAEQERKAISDRTRAALDAAKREGKRLGNPANLKNQLAGSAIGNQRKQAKANADAAEAAEWIAEAREHGAVSLHQIAAALNTAGHTTSRGKPWSATQVSRVLARVAAAA